MQAYIILIPTLLPGGSSDSASCLALCPVPQQLAGPPLRCSSTAQPSDGCFTHADTYPSLSLCQFYLTHSHTSTHTHKFLLNAPSGALRPHFDTMNSDALRCCCMLLCISASVFPLNVSCITHVSHIARHTSHVTHHVSHTCHTVPGAHPRHPAHGDGVPHALHAL